MDEPLGAAVRRAAARGWEGLTMVVGADGGDEVTLALVEDSPALPGEGRLCISLACAGEGPPTGLIVRLADDGDDASVSHAPALALDLRLEGVRSAVRRLARRGCVGIVGWSRASGELRWGRSVCLHPAAAMLATACARAGEWHAEDPGGSLASSLRWRLGDGKPLPRLVSGARLGDPPVLVVPAGYRKHEDASLSGILGPLETDGERMLARLASLRGVTVAEVALGPSPLVTWIGPPGVA
jgi:hypothetical protein